MGKSVQRGHALDDKTEFGDSAVPKLHKAAQNLFGQMLEKGGIGKAVFYLDFSVLEETSSD